MKIEEAIMIEDLMEYAKRNDYFNLTTREFAELDSKVSKALERQMPKPLRRKYINGTGVCDGCGQVVKLYDKYCSNCGCKLQI